MDDLGRQRAVVRAGLDVSVGAEGDGGHVGWEAGAGALGVPSEAGVHDGDAHALTAEPGLAPGRDTEEGARIGPPDILFFSLFLASSARFGLRVAWTWIGMAGLLGVTLILVSTTDVGGLPALPAVCLGFLLPNADLIWHALRRRGQAPVRIYGRTDTSFYDLEADVIERGHSAIVVLTRDRPPVMATIEPVREGDSFPALPPETPAPELLCRLRIGGTDAGEALVHDLPKGIVIVPRDENPKALYDIHPEQLAADEAKVERLQRERR